MNLDLWPIELDELIAYHKRREQGDLMSDDFSGQRLHAMRRESLERLKASPSQQYVPSAADQKDAERYRVVRQVQDWSYNMEHAATPEQFDAAVDAKQTI